VRRFRRSSAFFVFFRSSWFFFAAPWVAFSCRRGSFWFVSFGPSPDERAAPV
jgi:hypothetical protein